jgi:hypothetical protein
VHGNVALVASGVWPPRVTQHGKVLFDRELHGWDAARASAAEAACKINSQHGMLLYDGLGASMVRDAGPGECAE